MRVRRTYLNTIWRTCIVLNEFGRLTPDSAKHSAIINKVVIMHLGQTQEPRYKGSVQGIKIGTC